MDRSGSAARITCVRPLVRSLLLAISLVPTVGCGADAAKPAAPPESSRVFLAGDGELWVVDTESGSSRHFERPELSPGDPPHRIANRGDRLILWGYDTWSLDPDHPSEPLERIARDSWIWIPSMRRDRVWVGYLDPEHERTTRPLDAVREIDSTGNVTVPDAKPPGGQWPQVALNSGLLITQGDVVALWDPRSDEIVGRVPAESVGFLGPAHGNLVASCGMEECKAVVLTDFATREQRSIPAPAGNEFEISQAAFSPDGATLATLIRTVGRRADPARLALVSVDSGDVTVVPGSETSNTYTFPLWAGDGDQVYLAGGGFDEDAMLVAYSIADDEVRRIPLKVGPFLDAAVGEA